MKVAWELIHPLAQEGLSYKEILEKLKEDGSVDATKYVLGYELTVKEIARLNNLTPRPLSTTSLITGEPVEKSFLKGPW